MSIRRFGADLRRHVNTAEAYKLTRAMQSPEATGIPCDIRAARVLTAWMRAKHPAARCRR